MASGFWKRLLAAAGQGRPDGQEELTPEEAGRLREQGHVRRHYYFSGRVQEVGFRYTACAIAGRLGLTGWVLNLPDGRVEMEVQGKESVIAQLVLELKNTSYIRIERVVCENLPLKEGEDKFSTRFTC